jgi:hypothetical protein
MRSAVGDAAETLADESRHGDIDVAMVNMAARARAKKGPKGCAT